MRKARSLMFLIGGVLLFCRCVVASTADESKLKVSRFPSASTVEISGGGKLSLLTIGDRLGRWTLMEITHDTAGTSATAILEDFSTQTGHQLFIDRRGVRLDLPKSLESTSQDVAKLYLGHSRESIIDSASDVLGDEILSKGDDPDYDEVASVFPPIRKMTTYSFVGTSQTMDKVGFTYGGRSPDFDPAAYYPAINKIREEGKVWDGLVGGYLPVLRFVYPESLEKWTEMIAFAPLRTSNGNDRIQPVWYRIVHIENGSVKWAHYIDSYHPFRRGLTTMPSLSIGIW